MLVLRTRENPRAVITLDSKKLGTEVGIAKQNCDVATLLLGAWTSLLCDSPLEVDSGPKPRRTILFILHKSKSMGLVPLIDFLSNLADMLCREAFIDAGSLITEDLYHEFRGTPIFKEYYVWKETRDPKLLRYILTFLRFGKKCEFDNEEFHARALRSWLGTEERLSHLKLDGSEHIPIMRKIVSYLLSNRFSAPTFMGKHGPGAVVERISGRLYAKTLNFAMTPELERIYSEVFPRGKASEGLMLSYCSYFARRRTHETSTAAVSHLLFVPKNYKVSRSICKEPIAYMYFQQHFRWELEYMMHKGILRRFVKIDDQSRNQAGALYGSWSSAVDTIDLSAASDSVHLELVKAIFPQPLLDGLLACRTEQVLLPTGEYVHVNKFAPMGSAVCFPVQCIIYATVCLYAYMLRFSPAYAIDDILSSRSIFEKWVAKTIGRDFTPNNFVESFAVYGDDIVCDTRVTDDVVSILEDLGFVVNNDKSFIGKRAFRESCGVFAMYGEDVTPLHFKGRYFLGPLEAAEYARYISLANAAGDYGYRTLQSYMINTLLRWRPPKGSKLVPIRFSSDRNAGFAFYSANPRNTHLKKRVSPDYQREEVRSYVLRPVFEPEPSNEDDRMQIDAYDLHMSYRAAVSGNKSEDSFLVQRRSVLRSKIGWGWTPT